MGFRRGLVAISIAAAALGLMALPAAASTGSGGFGFQASTIAGFPTGAVFLSGGGKADPVSGFVRATGGFSCLADVAQGPLSGCLAGQGVRWDTDVLLRTTNFKCTGAVTESLKSATTNARTFVFQSDFYRAGDANDESITAQVIVSHDDIAPDIGGIQNVWVQGVGCGSALGSL
jgi:hypothetical protein